MKKTTTVKKEKDFYNIEIIIDDVAIIKSSISGKNGLLNIKSNQLIGEFGYYEMLYNTDKKFYMQFKTLNNEQFLNIYDVLKHCFMIYNYKIVKRYGNTLLVKENDSDKLHFLDMSNIRDENNIFNLEIDDVECLDFRGNINFMLSKNNSKALYKFSTGLVTNFEYDDIKRENGVTFFYKNNKIRFSCDGEPKFISKEFDEISFRRNLLYCKDGKEAYIYEMMLHNKKKLIYKTEKSAKFVVEFPYDNLTESYENLFIEEDENHKKSLISSKNYTDTEKIETKVLANDCDEIRLNKNYEYQFIFQFCLEKNGKQELFLYDSHNSKSMGSYDNIEYFGNDKFALSNGKSTDIVDITINKDPRMIIKNCRIINVTRNAIIFSQKSVLNMKLVGLYYYYSTNDFTNRYYNNIIKPTHDYIRPRSRYLYEVEDNKKKGIYHLGKLIIPIEYDDISLSYSPEYKNIDDAKDIYFALKKENSTILAKRKNYHFKDTDESVKLEELGEYKDVLFFKDIIVLKKLLNTLIYDYNGKLLGKFPFGTTVTSFDISKDKYKPRIIYCINNDYYFYKDGFLEKYYKEDVDICLATYETDNELFEVSSRRSDVLEGFTNYIDSMEDDLGETSLRELSKDENELELKNKYPSLVLKKVKKKEVR